MTGIERLVDIVNDGPYSGGMIHISVQKLREICEQIEREVDVKAEAMEALAFVNGHGGLEKARRELERAETWHLDKLEMYLLCTEYGSVKRLKRYLMPNCLEWPTYEDGEPVRIGDEFENARGGASVLRTVLIKDCRDSLGGDFYWKLGKGKNAVTLKNGERVKRPEPKVLDADGVEIRVGDTVWTTRDLDRFTVTNPNNGKFLSVSCEGEDGEDYRCYPTDLTHRAPVIAADGKPLREGETVYDINDAKGYPGTVVSTELDGFGHVKITCEEPTPANVFIHPSRITHERPDIKCRDCANWQKDPTADKMGVCWFYYHEHEGQDCYAARLGDCVACEEFISGAKALAERGA